MIELTGLNYDTTKQLLNELGKLKQITSDYIIELNDLWLESKIIYIRMEYSERNLRDFIYQKQQESGRQPGHVMDVSEYFISCGIFKEILECVQYLHELNPQIIHKNIKPENFLVHNKLGHKLCIKISDFFINCTRMTNRDDNSVIYASPELLSECSNITFQTDIYSLGVIAQEIFDCKFEESPTLRFDKSISINIRELSKIILLMVSPIYDVRPSCSDILDKQSVWEVSMERLVNSLTPEQATEAIQCSCFIPFWSGIVPPKFHGIAYMDGGFSDNLPIIDKNTITVSPFSGESDICPQDDTYNLFQVNLVNTSIMLSVGNLYRLTRILFPAHPEVLSKMCQQGFDDALRCLSSLLYCLTPEDKIACTRCLAIQSSFTLGEDDDMEADNDYENNDSDSGYENNTCGDGEHHSAINCTNCSDCQYRRQIAVLDSLPDAVVQAIQEACDQVNKGVINWLFRHRPMKLLSFLTIPYLLPIDITIVLFCKVWQQVPAIKQELKGSLYNLLSFLRSIVVKMESKRHLYSAKFSCQLAVTEFDYSHEDCPQVYAQNASPVQRKVSTIKLPKRKLTNSSSIPINPTPTARKLVEKAHSFSPGSVAMRKRSLYASDGAGISATSAQELLAMKARQRLDRLQQQSGGAGHQRKSYAGTYEQRLGGSAADEWPIDRRRSMIEMAAPRVKPPERVISKMNFGFSFDLKNKSNEEIDFELRAAEAGLASSAPDLDQNGGANGSGGTGDKVLDALKRLEDIDQTNAIEIANKALDWERECLQKYREFGECEGTGAGDGSDINKMIEVTQTQEALMAFYYTDENNRVKVTEIFNISPDDDGSGDTTGATARHSAADDDEDGLREDPLLRHQQSRSSLSSQSTVPSAQRRRKKSVILID
ncbi:unnamed protein product [Oppiella nova]|uniref:Protein kinase domain-containing protein n=1 Tax=Oppiella nova TaxID=334625 RepID=A0A7R9QT30_9ACAR|nr:unnamed protein product [Oppiella nova]CAG2173358.1 unnamed protein product [Oppiella nova]